MTAPADVASPALFWSPSIAAERPGDPTAGLIDGSGPAIYLLDEHDGWLPIEVLPGDAVRLVPTPEKTT